MISSAPKARGHIGPRLRFVPLLLILATVSGSRISAEGSQILEGVWRFEKETDTRPDGTPVTIRGPDFEGILIYRADGFMSVNLMPRGRTWTTGNATLEEFRTTVAEGTGYAGRYEIDEKRRTVTHIVSVSLDPANEGQRLLRGYSLEGGKLVLSGERTYKGEPMRFHVVWERVPPQEASVARVPVPPVSAHPAPVRVSRTTPDGGTITTALLTVPEVFMPYVGFTLPERAALCRKWLANIRDGRVDSPP